MKHWFFRHLADAERRGTLAIEVAGKSLPVNAGHVLSQIEFPTEKPPAMVTLDDRAITFKGIWPDLDELLKFRPWNK